MRQQLESWMLALAIGAACVIAAKRVKLPWNVVLVVVGLLLVFAVVLPRATLEPDLVLLLFLPMLVFEAALSADADQLARAKAPILALALPGVALSLGATALIATYVLDLPFAVAALLGALLAITDTVSVLLAFRAVRVPARLAAIMEGESLFNDGTALVLVSVCAAVVSTGGFEPTRALGGLAIAIVGGGLIGLAGGALAAMVLERVPDHLTAILASVVFVFATSLGSERVHASSVIAVVVAGLLVGRAARKNLEPSRVLALRGFWEMSGFAINVLLFLLVGMQIQASTLIAEAGAIALALVALHGGRAIAVYGSFAALRVSMKTTVPSAWKHVMVLGNIKGALSMAAVLALPVDLPYRDRLVTIVFGVTVITLVSQGLPFGRFLRWLGVTLGSGSAAVDRAKASLLSAKRGQRDLDALLEAGLLSRREHAERRAFFQRRVIDAEATLRSPSSGAERSMWVEATLLTGRKAALEDAARRGLLEAEIAEAEIAELDRELVELTAHAEEEVAS